MKIFSLCIHEGRLETAASYLMVLQANLDVKQTRQHSVELLAAALQSKKWALGRELIRFLRV